MPSKASWAYFGCENLQTHFDVFNDPGHGWAKVPIELLEHLGIAGKITRYSYMNGENAYLEEDCDLSLFIDTMKACGITPVFHDHYTEGDNQSRIRWFAAYVPRPT